MFHITVSSGGSSASRWDPDLLKTDVAMARNRVGRLKRELHQIKHEVANTEAGMQTLAQYVNFHLSLNQVLVFLFLACLQEIHYPIIHL